jgi:hypothetical protein
MRKIAKYLDDLLLMCGCTAILYGLSMWSAPVTWIVGGLMLIGFGVLIAKGKVKHAAN